MKPTMTVLVCMLAVGLALAQSPSIIQNTRNTMNAVSGNAAAASNAALGIQEKAPGSTAAKASTAPTPVAGNATGAVSVKRSPMRPSKAQASKPKPAAVARQQAAPKPVAQTAPGNSPEGDNPEVVDPTASESKYNSNGRRDPFVSPVVSHIGGSGCSTGKKCLEIGMISLQGIVRSDTGFIAVVSNGMNKAYFLRENDPVFNGYVVKITADTIVFQETLQDRLGKTFTREVVKKITTPAV